MTKKLNDLSKEELASNLELFFAKEANDIVSSISHDIKNPLGIIDLSLGLLEDKITPLLESADAATVKKITTFISNINTSISRCELILENTQILRSVKVNQESKELNMHKFFEDFYIFSKSSLKRSKVSLENGIDEKIVTTINQQSYARALTLFIKVTFEKIKADKNLTSKIYFDGENLIIETQPMNEADQIIFNPEDAVDYQILKQRFDIICKLLNMNYSSKSDEKKYATKLSWPKI